MITNLQSSLSREEGRLPVQSAIPVPLVVDLDGTLVSTDLFLESLIVLIECNPLYIFAVLFWLCKGRAYLKRQISLRRTVDVSTLPYNHEVLNYLKAQRARGRRIVLATGNDERIARQVADYLQVFDIILASNGIINLSGRQKRDRLVAEFGERSFDYAGNSRSDLPVWRSSHKAILVNTAGGLSRKAAKVTEIEKIFQDREEKFEAYLQALRLHQWTKNLLVFVPLVLAHRFFELDLLARNLLAFVAFGLCASSIYLINDMADLQADRYHPQKRLRPFAACRLSLFSGLGMIPLLLAICLCVSLALPTAFFGMLALYFVLNLAYSFYLKRIVILDVVVLAGLYTMRIMAGSASVGIWPSPWLLAFSTFLFLSLALVKRYAELVIMGGLSGETVQVRGYQGIDKELLASMGCGSGYVAVLVLAIYITSGASGALYSRHNFLWLLCPLLLYWISYVWLIAHRGKMQDDPLAFTMKDRISHIVFLLVVIILILAK